MQLSKPEIDRLLQLIARTDAVEIDCDQCLALVAEFAERKLEGLTISEGLLAVERHLSVCDECKQEYEALMRTLGSAGGACD